MDKSWDSFIYLFTHPYFWMMILFGISLQYILEFMRRFYPKSWQENIAETEEYADELYEDKDDKRIMLKLRKIEGSIFAIPIVSVTFIYLLFSYYNGAKFTPNFIFSTTLHMSSSIMFLSMGIYMLKKFTILKYFFKDDYQRYLEIDKKAHSFDFVSRFIRKYMKLFGYVFLIFGISTIVFLD